MPKYLQTDWRYRLLGKILHIANSRPPIYSREFYAMKDKILQKHGLWIDMDIQYINKGKCRSCGGTGRFKCHWKPPETCWNCWGSGIYQFWVFLRKYNLGGFTFHIPIERVWKEPPEWEYLKYRAIRGYIEHPSYPYRLDTECFFLLALIFDRKLFFNSFGRFGMLNGKRTPLVFLANLLYQIRRIIPTLRMGRI